MKRKHEFLTNFLSSAFVPVIIESLFWLNSRITKTFCLKKRQRNEPRRPNKETLSAKSKNVSDHTMLKRSAQNDKMFRPPEKSHFFHITLTICKKITLR